MKRILAACLLILCLLATPTLVLAIQLQELHPTSFVSNGAKIVGWHWLRRANDYAEWTFKLPQNLPPSVIAVLCFSTLSTNTYNGGAGFDSKLKVKMSQGGNFRVKLKNDCPCLKYRSSGDSHGIGYQSHGCAKRKISRKHGANTNILKVRVEYPGGHHTAVQKSSLKMILMIKERHRR